MKIKGAIFDMDGTAVDSLHFWDYLWKSISDTFLSGQKFLPSEDLNKKIRTTIFTNSMTLLNENYHFLPRNDDFVKYAENLIVSFYKTVKPKNGVIELLQFLKSKSVKIYLATATDTKLLKYALESCNLTEYFDGIFSCADIGVSKDKPDIYYKVIDAMHLTPSEVCVFEDALVAIRTAKNAGFNTVGIFDKHNFNQEQVKLYSDYYVEDGKPLSDAIKIFE